MSPLPRKFVLGAKTVGRAVIRDVDLRFRIRQRALSTPKLSEAITRVDPTLSACQIRRETAIVLDGFPRSGNSYGRAVVIHANPTVEISSHLHAPRAVSRAFELGKPAVVLIRRPGDAVASMVQFTPGLTIEAAIRGWLSYYSEITTMKGRVHLLDFRNLIQDPNCLIRAFNEQGAGLRSYLKDVDSEQLVRAAIDRASLVYPLNRREHVTARPAAVRRHSSLVWMASSPSERRLLEQANDLYYELALKNVD